MLLVILGSWDQAMTCNPFLLIMNGFLLLSASTFIYLTYQILDDGFSETLNWRRDPNVQFIEHSQHVLDVPKIEGVAVKTEKQCRLRCLNNSRCFSTNIGALTLPNGNISCDLLPTDKYNASEKFKANNNFRHYSIRVSINRVYFNFASLLWHRSSKIKVHVWRFYLTFNCASLKLLQLLMA